MTVPTVSFPKLRCAVVTANISHAIKFVREPTRNVAEYGRELATELFGNTRIWESAQRSVLKAQDWRAAINENDIFKEIIANAVSMSMRRADRQCGPTSESFKDGMAAFSDEVGLTTYPACEEDHVVDEDPVVEDPVVVDDAKKDVKKPTRKGGCKKKGTTKKTPQMRVWGERECVVCMDAESDSALKPCGHGVMCARCCADVVNASGRSTCPCCRVEIKGVYRFHWTKDGSVAVLS